MIINHHQNFEMFTNKYYNFMTGLLQLLGSMIYLILFNKL